ncbi:MAG: VanZ family protein [Archangium sp.]|nr:VanZ family protein [Archangium sp.]
MTSGQRLPRALLVVLLLGIYSTLGVVRVVSNALRDANLLRVSVAFIFGLVLTALSLVVFKTRELRTPRAFVTALGLLAIYAFVIWPMESPEEKLHFVEYGAVGVLAFLSAPERWSELKRLAAAVLFTAAAGWIDEGIQALLPSRYYDLRDVGFNALAGLLSVCGLGVFRFISRR